MKFNRPFSFIGPQYQRDFVLLKCLLQRAQVSDIKSLDQLLSFLMICLVSSVMESNKLEDIKPPQVLSLPESSKISCILSFSSENSSIDFLSFGSTTRAKTISMRFRALVMSFWSWIEDFTFLPSLHQRIEEDYHYWWIYLLSCPESTRSNILRLLEPYLKLSG